MLQSAKKCQLLLAAPLSAPSTGTATSSVLLSLIKMNRLQEPQESLKKASARVRALPKGLSSQRTLSCCSFSSSEGREAKFRPYGALSRCAHRAPPAPAPPRSWKRAQGLGPAEKSKAAKQQSRESLRLPSAPAPGCLPGRNPGSRWRHLAAFFDSHQVSPAGPRPSRSSPRSSLQGL